VRQGEICFNNVTFNYPSSNQQVLKNFNLKIEAGTKIGLIGPSGSGKSTINDLILQFYHPSEGNITIDGRDIRDFNITELRSQIGYVSQDPEMFDISVKDNIIFG